MKKKLLILKVTLAVLIGICSFHIYKQFNFSKKQNQSGIKHEANLDVDFSPYFDFTNIPSNLLPTWIPEEMEFRDIDDIETDRFKMVDEIFESTDGKNFMSVTVTYLYEDIYFTYEKDDSPVEVIEKDGIEYFIMGNLNTNLILWRNGSFECLVNGTVSRDVLKHMIDSIPSK